MKRIFLMFLAIAFSSTLGGAATAGRIKVPKEICFTITSASPGIYFSLGAKSSGSVKYADKQKVKFYALQGIFDNQQDGIISNVDGSGYMDGNLFLFRLSGSYYYSGEWETHTIQGSLVMSTDPPFGNMNVFFNNDDPDNWWVLHTIQGMPCDAMDMPEVILSAPEAVPPAGADTYSGR